MHRHRSEDNIRLDLKEIGINTGKWLDSGQNRDYWRVLVNVVSNAVSKAMVLFIFKMPFSFQEKNVKLNRDQTLNLELSRLAHYHYAI